jgi:hypothetical protein
MKYQKIHIFDVNGQEMNTIIDKYHSPGEYEITFDGNNLASGIYFYSMIIDGNIVSTKKMLLIK